MQDLVKRVTGCKEVFIVTSTLRGTAKKISVAEDGQNANGNEKIYSTNGATNGATNVDASERNEVPEDVVGARDPESNATSESALPNTRFLKGYGTTDEILSTEAGRQLHERIGKEQQVKGNTQPYHLPMTLPPSRFPHIDYTSLGARRVIRSMREDIFQCARKTGIIDREDSLSANSGPEVTPDNPSSNDVIEAEYNQPGNIGPRYAIYSLWRPLKTCTRDHLVMISDAEFRAEGDERMNNDLQVWAYDMRKPGFNGDWHWNLATIRAQDLDADAIAKVEEKSNLKWHYIPDQKPEECLMFKLFDSASLGKNATEAAGVPHGSPDLGDVAHGDPRQSIELRAIAFW